MQRCGYPLWCPKARRARDFLLDAGSVRICSPFKRPGRAPPWRSQVRARRPGGPETTPAAVRATFREGPAPSALNARGAESLRPWRLQPPLCPGPLEQHLGAGRPWLRIFPTFCPAQYNPAAAPLGGAWVPTAKGGERGGRGGLGSSAGAHQAEAVRLRGRRVSGRRLFVSAAPRSALRLPPMGRARAAAVGVRPPRPQAPQLRGTSSSMAVGWRGMPGGNGRK